MPIRGIGREDDPLRGHARKQLDDIDGRERGGVVETRWVVGEPGREHALAGDAGVGEDEGDFGKAQGQLGQWVHRRHPPPGVDQDRHSSIPGDGEDRLGGRVVEAEGLGAGMQLDPPRTERQAAFRLSNGMISRIEPAVRGQSTVALIRPGQHAIVGPPVSRVPIRVVEREDACPAVGSDQLELPEQGREILGPAVLVSAEMGMRVDDNGPRGHQLGELDGEGREGCAELVDADHEAPRTPPGGARSGPATAATAGSKGARVGPR